MKNRTKVYPEYQKRYTEAWSSISPSTTIFCEQTIEGALGVARRIGGQESGVHVLVTGSLHLVSGALCLLEPSEQR